MFAQPQLNVVVIDDHVLFLEGITMTLDAHARFRVSGTAESGERGLDVVDEVAPDLVVLDVSMPGMGGLETLRILRERHPELPVLVLTMHEEASYGLHAIRAGASGYLEKGSSVAELVEALETIAEGHVFVSTRLAGILANHSRLAPARADGHSALSTREFEVFIRLASGMTTTQIARELGINVKTVSTYRSRVFAKLHVDTNVELTMYALRNHLLDAGALDGVDLNALGEPPRTASNHVARLG